MAFHELGTNSAKYGVLSGRKGTVEVVWAVEQASEEMLRVTWREWFSVPREREPGTGKGFGTVVLDRVTRCRWAAGPQRPAPATW